MKNDELIEILEKNKKLLDNIISRNTRPKLLYYVGNSSLAKQYLKDIRYEQVELCMWKLKNDNN